MGVVTSIEVEIEDKDKLQEIAFVIFSMTLSMIKFLTSDRIKSIYLAKAASGLLANFAAKMQGEQIAAQDSIND